MTLSHTRSTHNTHTTPIVTGSVRAFQDVSFHVKPLIFSHFIYIYVHIYILCIFFVGQVCGGLRAGQGAAPRALPQYLLNHTLCIHCLCCCIHCVCSCLLHCWSLYAILYALCVLMCWLLLLCHRSCTWWTAGGPRSGASSTPAASLDSFTVYAVVLRSITLCIAPAPLLDCLCYCICIVCVDCCCSVIAQVCGGLRAGQGAAPRARQRHLGAQDLLGQPGAHSQLHNCCPTVTYTPAPPRLRCRGGPLRRAARACVRGLRPCARLCACVCVPACVCWRGVCVCARAR
jgi:hypothetical protein